MPYAGKILKRDEAWTLSNLPEGTAVTVLTLNKNAHVAEVDLLVASGGSVGSKIWKDAQRVHFRISTVEGAALPSTFVLSQPGGETFSVTAATDVSILADWNDA